MEEEEAQEAEAAEVEAELAAATAEAEAAAEEERSEANRKISLQNGINVILFPHAKAIIYPPPLPSLTVSHCLCEFSLKSLLAALPAALRQLAALQLYEIRNNFGLFLPSLPSSSHLLFSLLFPHIFSLSTPLSPPTPLSNSKPNPKNSARNEAWRSNDATLLRSATAAAQQQEQQQQQRQQKRKSGAIERECQTRKTSSSAVDSAANVTRGCIDCAGQWLQVTTTTTTTRATTAKETTTTQSRSQRRWHRCRRHRHRCCCCLFTE